MLHAANLTAVSVCGRQFHLKLDLVVKVLVPNSTLLGTSLSSSAAARICLPLAAAGTARGEQGHHGHQSLMERQHGQHQWQVF
ncbi:hypothetical protein E2C01_086464 [Portunus trituberculatus]|uniref:Uncharacterized protein n=1 Tax=Portunus trituberculatus TaxID=210409 RepID=A0A5B7JEN4_PORTR|nr:hypothetical protein [Portunus trituberculatus]